MSEDELRKAYEELTEQLQALCDEYGCLGGENRVKFLRRQLWAYKSALQEVRGTREIHYAWDVVDYAFALRRKA